MGVGLFLQDGAKEGRARGEDHFVSLDLVFIADKSDVEEVFLFSELSECNADVGFEIVPPQTKLLICHLQCLSFLLSGGTLKHY